MSDRVAVGRVGKPHGIKGAFFVEHGSEAPERFSLGAQLYVDGEPTKVLESKRAGGRPVIRLDREARRGATLEVDKVALPEAGPDEYYVFQLVGLDVTRVGGVPLGRVTNVETGVANDVLELDSGLLLPLVGACVREIDLNAGTIVVEPGFDQAD
ncbi:MAG: ribosome maturation factor RimM [Gaiellaceae bacterium]